MYNIKDWVLTTYDSWDTPPRRGAGPSRIFFAVAKMVQHFFKFRYKFVKSESQIVGSIDC